MSEEIGSEQADVCIGLFIDRDLTKHPTTAPFVKTQMPPELGPWYVY
jgi:hypothetical protein